MSLICPICGAALSLEGGACRCGKGHSFDPARSGYVNLLMDPSSHGHGDDKAMLLSRRAFLEAGWYAPLAEAVSRETARLLPDGGCLTDAGCGEGYYTEAALNALSDAGKKASAFAFDIAKEAARMTAVRLKGRATVFVASAYKIPLASASQDLVLSLFAPYAREELARILKPGGVLLRLVPDRDHLWELKEALYDAPRENASDPREEDSLFLPLASIPVRRTLDLDNAALRALFEMTPYAKKTAPGDREKLLRLDRLSVSLSCKLLLSKKACEERL